MPMTVTGEWLLPILHLNSWATCYVFSPLTSWGEKWESSFCWHRMSSHGQTTTTRWTYGPRSCCNGTDLFYHPLSIIPHTLWIDFPIHFDLLISLPLTPSLTLIWKGPCSLIFLWMFHIYYLACETHDDLVSSELSASKISQAMLQWSVYWFVSSGIWYFLSYLPFLSFCI